MNWERSIEEDPRFEYLLEWENTHHAERFYIKENKITFASIFLTILISLLLLLLLLFLLLFIISIIYVIVIYSKLIGILVVFLCIPLFVISSYIVFVFWIDFLEDLSLIGYYVDADSFTKVVILRNKIKEIRKPISWLITIELSRFGPKSHQLLVVFCADKSKKEVSFRNLLESTNFVITSRYSYFTKKMDIERPHIWADVIEKQEDTSFQELERLAETGKHLVQKYTSRQLDYYYPERFCPNCNCLNTNGSTVCNECKSKLAIEIPFLLDTD